MNYNSPEKASPDSGNGSPLLIITQWQKDAKGAVEDAYANYVLGDDTGESARLVLVANPAEDLALLENTGRGKHPPHVLLNDPGGKRSKSNSGSTNNNLLLFSHRDYYTDANRQTSLLLGGRKTHKHDPHASSFASCGITFVEINGRAYVHALDEDSDAYQAGVRPKDCIQYAAVLAREWEDPFGVDFDPISSQALDREDAGQRITFEELKRVFLQGSGIFGDWNYNATAHAQHAYNNPSDPNMDPQFERRRSASGNVIMGPPGSPSNSNFVPPLPTTIRITAKNPCGALLPQETDCGDESIGGSITNKPLGVGPQGPVSVQSASIQHNTMTGPCSPSSIVLVFRRTRQRPPKAWNVWPNYRLDDECEMATKILESLTTTHAINGSGGTSSPQSRSLSPSRRTRRSNSVSMDDDTSTMFDDTSTAFDQRSQQSSTARVLFSTDGKGGFDDAGNVPLDVDDAGVEASTLRGMIAKAVGLAFVRTNKVVFGVSLYGGSGIVLARLPDGTWSAPSFIGMGGVGLGLQVGMEVASYIFILQTAEALEHFFRGGSFTLGANVGAALANMGREAIGAASVSGALCGMSQPAPVIKEDEYNFETDEEELEYVLEENGNDERNEGPDDGSRRVIQRKHRRRRGDAGCTPSSCHHSINTRNSKARYRGCVGECSALAVNSAAVFEEGAGGLAPFVAYAKSEGLYVGVSLEGSRIFARPEANARAYKYSSYNHKAVTVRDILTGKIVTRPPEAEYLYALLHSIELAHEWASLPAIPNSPFLIGDSNDKSNLRNSHNSKRNQSHSTNKGWNQPWDFQAQPYCPAVEESGDTSANDHEDGSLITARKKDSEEAQDLEEFADKFRDFLFGGITVTRISTNKREQRTLWLSSPAMEDATSSSDDAAKASNSNSGAVASATVDRGQLRLGFVSKLYSATAQRKHLSASLINDVKNSGAHGVMGAGGSVISEMEGDELTLDSALLDNQSLLTTTGTLQERVELSKKLSIDLVDVMYLRQKMPPNIRLLDTTERDRVICLESSDNTRLVFVGKSVEETRLLYCGLKILLEKETARLGIRGGQHSKSNKRNRAILSALKNGKTSPSMSSKYQNRLKHNNNTSGYASSDVDDTDQAPYDPSDYYSATMTSEYRDSLPEGWRSWGRVPGRSYMRAQSTSPDDGYPTYAHGQLLIRDVCKNVLLPLPLPLCRVLLLDSSSPVISKWETERGDADFERTPWTFPPATPREMEQFQSEHQLIASGSMCGAHRTISYERCRNGQRVRLSETHIVDSDDSDKLAFQVNERLPRRGFSIKVKILLRAVDNGNSCEATVLGEIRPVGKNMSDPAAVHKALVKVLEELRYRYGTDCVGLMAGFMSAIETMPKDETKRSRSTGRGSSTSSWRSGWEEKKENDVGKKKILGKTSVVKFEDVMNADVGIADVPDPRFAQESRPSNRSANDYKSRKPITRSAPVDDTFTNSTDPVTIEVKPYPKVRLSLMPSPREEDEEDLDEEGEPKPKPKPSSSSKKGKSFSKRSLLAKKRSKRKD